MIVHCMTMTMMVIVMVWMVIKPYLLYCIAVSLSSNSRFQIFLSQRLQFVVEVFVALATHSQFNPSAFCLFKLLNFELRFHLATCKEVA